MENTLVYKFLSILFENDPDTCKEIWVELDDKELFHLEWFFKNNEELWDWIKENGVPFSGEEEEYDRMISVLNSKESTIGYDTYNKILEMC